LLCVRSQDNTDVVACPGQAPHDQDVG